MFQYDAKLAELLNSIVPGAGEAEHTAETVNDIYRIFGTGDDWTGDVRIVTGVSKPVSLRNAEGTDPFQIPVKNPRIADGANPGNVTFDQRLLDTNEIMVFEIIDPQDWIGDFPEFQPTGNLINLSLNTVIRDVVFQMLQNRVWNQTSRNIAVGGLSKQTSGALTVDVKYIINDYQAGDDFTNVGAASNATGVIFTATGTTPTTWTNSSELEEFATSFTEGFIPKIKVDADVVNVPNLGVITKDNALEIATNMVNAIPDSIADRITELTFITSRADFQKIQDANRETQQNGNFLQQADVDRIFNKYRIVWKSSMPENTMFITITGTGLESNLVKGLWVENDITNFLMGKEAMQDKDYFILLRFYLGVQYRTGKHIVFYEGV